MSNQKITKLQENVLSPGGSSSSDSTTGFPVIEPLFATKESKAVSEARIEPTVIKKTILFVTRPIAPPWDEASKNFAYHLAINLAKLNQNLEIHLMTKGELPGLPENIIQHSVYTNAEKDFSFSQKVRSLLFQGKNKNKFDIVHYFFTPSRLNSLVIKNFLYPHQSKTFQTVATLREDLNPDREIKKNIFGEIPIAYSNYTTRKLKKLGFLTAQHIYPGIDLELYQPRPKNENLLEEFGFQKDDFIIAFTGEYVRLGGLDNVLESFENLVNKIPNLKLLLALRVKNNKDSLRKKKVKEMLQEKNLLNKVAFADGIDFEKWNVSHLYNLSDVSLFPVHNMNGKFDVPLVIPEAMACQKPVILSDLPILKEFANHNNAVIVSPNNTGELTEAILDLYNNPEKREQIALAGMKFSRQNFDIQYIAQRYEQLYFEV